MPARPAEACSDSCVRLPVTTCAAVGLPCPQELQAAGYFGAVFDAACRAEEAEPGAAAGDGAGDGDATATAVKAVRRALKKSGSTACREGLLQGLAQLVLPGAAAAAAKATGAAGAWAPEAAEARLATAVYRCVVQTLSTPVRLDVQVVALQRRVPRHPAWASLLLRFYVASNSRLLVTHKACQRLVWLLSYVC